MRRIAASLIIAVGCVLWLHGLGGSLQAQIRISPTPLSVVIPTSAPLPTSVNLPTPTPTWTPTEIPSVRLQAKQADNPINVRAEPDPGGERLGALDPSGQYEVFGRYFRWLQFAYDASPTGRAWVFDDLVDIIGEEDRIPIVDPFSTPTPSSDEQFAQEGPLNDATATAQARIVALPTDNVPEAIQQRQEEQAALPTFTAPPELAEQFATVTPDVIAAPSPTPGAFAVALERVATGNIPPIVPIAVLGLLGLVGLVISLMRGI